MCCRVIVNARSHELWGARLSQLQPKSKHHPRECKVHEHRERQKDEDKFDGIEEHRRLEGACRSAAKRRLRLTAALDGFKNGRLTRGGAGRFNAESVPRKLWMAAHVARLGYAQPVRYWARPRIRALRFRVPAKHCTTAAVLEGRRSLRSLVPPRAQRRADRS